MSDSAVPNVKPAAGMKCPVDQTDLVMSDRQGIEIDYCPRCRGIWLDRGELDKIVERSMQNDRPQPGRPAQRDDDAEGGYGGRGHGGGGHGGGGHGGGQSYGGRRRGSWLSEIFD